MQLIESFSIGVKEIQAHKLRSILTTLGVIFGVAAVISTVAIGAGAQEETLREISVLGTNNIRIRKKTLEGADSARAMRMAPYGLTLQDVDLLASPVPEWISVYGVARKFEQRASYNGEQPAATVMGVTPGYSEAIDFRVQPGKGRFINQFDVQDQKRICVIGDDIRQILFPLEDPLNQTIQIGSRNFTVVGVMERKAVGSGGGLIDVGNMNQYIMIPLQTGMALFVSDRRSQQLDEIVIKMRNEGGVQELAALFDKRLSRLHGGIEDYEIIIPEELLRQKQRIQRIFGYTLIAIAGISLLVGGIGIMNIMLSTVTQRTREIGVRRAIGATRNDVLSQFLIESLVLSIVGGLMGVGMGFGLATVIHYYTNWNTPISSMAIIVSFSVSALTGLAFGAYPAMKAAQLDPIEALRYE